VKIGDLVRMHRWHRVNKIVLGVILEVSKDCNFYDYRVAWFGDKYDARLNSKHEIELVNEAG